MLESSIKSALNNDNSDTANQLIKKSLELIINMITLKPSLNSPWKDRSFDKEKYVWSLIFSKTNT